MKRKILLVDDEEIFLRPLARTILSEGYLVDTASTAAEARQKLRADEFDLLITDVRMAGMDGISFTREVKGEHPDMPVIVMTAYGSIRTAVEAMKAGAEDYILKPFEPDEILLLIGRALEIQALRVADRYRLERDQEDFELRKTLVGKSDAMSRLKEEIESVRGLTTTVLLTGETGTGKGLVARAIHYGGSRRNRPFIEVNCAAIPEPLFESELFGFTRGSFTGASGDRKGHFLLAHGGTLFLDEIAEAPLSIQPKLLSAIQDKRIMRIGGSRKIDVDVRIIAATNRRLEDEVEAGRFRKDLFFRLNVFPIRVPPLRERKEDIPELASLFLRKYALKCGKKILGIAPDALRAMQDYDWPGNVRELENFIERAVIRARSEVLDPSEELLPRGEGGGALAVPAELPFREAKERVVAAFERRYIEEALRRTGGRLSEAAREAGMDNKNFSEKMKRYGITLDTFRRG